MVAIWLSIEKSYCVKCTTRMRMDKKRFSIVKSSWWIINENLMKALKGVSKETMGVSFAVINTLIRFVILLTFRRKNQKHGTNMIRLRNFALNDNGSRAKHIVVVIDLFAGLPERCGRRMNIGSCPYIKAQNANWAPTTFLNWALRIRVRINNFLNICHWNEKWSPAVLRSLCSLWD